MNEENKTEMLADDVPYIAHEMNMARMERVTKRLTVALVVAIAAALFISLAFLYANNRAWLNYEQMRIEAQDEK